jgi:hypothetical protein
MIVWDGAAQHKSRIVREYLDSTKGAIQMALLPGYSPDLNPVEYLWAWLKRHALANFCPRSRARWWSSRPPREASCAAVNAASRLSLAAGSKPSCGDVMDYVNINRQALKHVAQASIGVSPANAVTSAPNVSSNKLLCSSLYAKLFAASFTGLSTAGRPRAPACR